MGTAPDQDPSRGVCGFAILQCLHFARGVNTLGGLGGGISLIDHIDVKNDGKANLSWLPLYAYFPLYSRDAYVGSLSSGGSLYSPFAYLFCSANTWAADRNYYQCGVGCEWSLGFEKCASGRNVPYYVGLKLCFKRAEEYKKENCDVLNAETGYFLFATSVWVPPIVRLSARQYGFDIVVS